MAYCKSVAGVTLPTPIDWRVGWKWNIKRRTPQVYLSLLFGWSKRFRIPEDRSCDGGTNLTSQESKSFFDEWFLRLRISSAHYRQSDGQTCRSGCQICQDVITGQHYNEQIPGHWCRHQYLNTPLQNSDASPAKLLTNLTGQNILGVILSKASLYLRV